MARHSTEPVTLSITAITMAKKRDKSLGDEFTQLGDSEPVSPPESERSLGDQSTYGDAGDQLQM